ncbi:MAG: hypothetical protein ACL7AY_15315 [Candidatus Arsenophonus phytopathogenicus]
MSISFGSGFFETKITSYQINKMMDFNYRGEGLFIEIWEKIKNFFFSTGRDEAIDNLKKLCNPQAPLSLNEVESIFFKLKELASTTHKNRFCNSHLYSSKDNYMHIQGDDGNVIIGIAEKDGQCFYSVLNKIFICNNEGDISYEEY